MLVFVIPAWRLHTLIPWSQRLSFLANFATRTAFIFLFARSTESREKKAAGQDRWIGILTFMPDQLLTVVSDWRIFMKVYLWQNSITRDRYQIIQIVHASIQSWIATSRFYMFQIGNASNRSWKTKPVSGIMQLVKMQKGILSGKRYNAKREGRGSAFPATHVSPL